MIVYCDRTDCYNNGEGECYSEVMNIDKKGNCTEYAEINYEDFWGEEDEISGVQTEEL